MSAEIISTAKPNRILISACLLGQEVRYDGGHNLLNDARVQLWQAQGRLVPFCPECAGGLPTPRAPAEQIQGRVLTCDGEDVTEAFELGAELALAKAQQQQVVAAILKARSPSCGKGRVYDGSFSRQLKEGDGVTAALLMRHGIQVFSEFELDAAEKYLTECDKSA
ncbi:DUF523 domain-containing protein [Shewanella algae]|uniref:DUF523 domain-containing protein n=1 Tax=Shewanella algae TaxID=38313 RepID=UPI0031F53AE1